MTPYTIYSLVPRTTQAKSSFFYPPSTLFCHKSPCRFREQKKSGPKTALSLKNNNVNIST
jgi:hypothetical protein